MKLYRPSASVVAEIRMSGMRTDAPATGSPFALTVPLTVIACWADNALGPRTHASTSRTLLLQFLSKVSWIGVVTPCRLRDSLQGRPGGGWCGTSRCDHRALRPHCDPSKRRLR